MEKSERDATADKILVIGTSNSIVQNGWFDGFVEAYKEKDPKISVERIALGGAPFSQFLPVAEDVNGNSYKFIIVDTSPNDEAYSDSIGSEWLTEKLYRDFLSILSEKTRVCVLRIPQERFFGKVAGFAFLQKNACADIGVDYVDASSILKELSLENNVPVYRDAYHPTTIIAHALGRKLADHISAAPNKEHAKASRLTTGRYGSLSIREDRFEIVNVENTLIKCKVHILGVGEFYKFERPVFAFGMQILTERTFCVLRLHSPNGTFRDLQWYFRGLPKVGKIQFVPFHNGHFVEMISVVRPWHSVEAGLHTVPPAPPYELGFSHMMVHGFEYR